MTYYSQIGQDQYYIEKIIKFKKGGRYIDIGAYDGITTSNTATLELELGWSGVCIEPNKDLYNQLVKNRPNSINLNCAAWCKNEELELEIPLSNHRNIKGDLLSRLTTIHNDNKKFKEHFANETILQKIQARTITDISDEYYHLPCHYNYMSLDVEGVELEVLKGIDFRYIHIDYMSIEHGNRQDYLNELIKFMGSKNYKLARINQFDVEFQRL